MTLSCSVFYLDAALKAGPGKRMDRRQSGPGNADIIRGLEST